MTQSEEIKEMKSVIDSLRIQVACMTAKQRAIATTILKIIPEFNTEVASFLYSEYVNWLELYTTTALDGIEGTLYEKKSGPLVAHRFEIFSGIRNMKTDPAYRQQKSNPAEKKEN